MNTVEQRKRFGFSLVEVVLSLGVIAFSVVAIIGLLPLGLSTSHSAQDETRAAQIAQDIFSSIASQTITRYVDSSNWTATIKQAATKTAGDFSYDVNLTNSSGYTFVADNDGHLVVPGASLLNYPYQVSLLIAPNPTGFDTGYASQVTVRVIKPPSANWSATPTSSQTARDFVRIFSRY